MKIILDNIIFELQKAGGISAIWAKHLDYLEKAGYAYKVVEGKNATRNIFRSRLNIHSDKIVTDRFPLLFLRRYATVNASFGDIFHSSYFRIANNRMKNVVTVHDLIYEKFESGLRKKIHCTQKVHALKNASAIICVSNHTKMDLLEIYPWVGTKPVSVVYNGVDDDYLPLLNKPDMVDIDGLVIFKNKFLLYVGSRGYCKNFPLVLEIMNSSIVKDWKLKLVIVGGGPFSSDEVKKFTEYGIYDSIVKLEHISSAELNVLYNLAVALLFPSYYEGFGIPALEASRAKCLVIASNSSSIPEVIGESPFSFDPYDTKAALKNIELLNDKQIVQNAIDVAYKNSHNFSWNNTSEQTINVYKAVLGEVS